MALEVAPKLIQSFLIVPGLIILAPESFLLVFLQGDEVRLFKPVKSLLVILLLSYEDFLI